MSKKIYIIGEVGQAHEGSIGMAHSHIDALAKAGIDAVKFQMHIAEAESSIYEQFRTGFDFHDTSRMDYWRRMEFTKMQWIGLKDHCKEKSLDFIISPFSLAAIDLLQEIGVDKIKIGSGESGDSLFLKKVADTGLQIILSSGMSSVSELDQSVKYLKSRNCNVSILQCTTAYPTKPEQWGLNVIQDFKNRYDIPIGFSDHSGDIFACLAAASLGAEILEFHITFDKRIYGPDATSSLTVDQAITLIKGVRQIETALNDPVNKTDHYGFEEMRSVFGRSIALNKTLEKGHIIKFDDLESKKPSGYGISPKNYPEIIGRPLSRAMQKWEFLNFTDLI
jgi:N,N'-diacetyllegionaminate synthase